ncbi:MAG: hypothetical protein HZB23_12655 [Deltaproteobacteria bacterium]|nr:hypothetical protein [Deltaproteobacteria bacterium]
MTAKTVTRAAIALLFLFITACAAHQPDPGFKPVDLSADARTGKIVRKADNFMIIMDASQSMAEPDVFKGVTRFNRAWDIVARINATLPNVGFMAALRSASGPFNFNQSVSKLYYGPTRYDRQLYKEAMEHAILSKGKTPLADSINLAAKDLSYAKGTVSVLILSDGGNNVGDPVLAAKKMKAAYGDRLCINVIQIGENVAGKKLLSSIVEHGGCGELSAEADLATADGVADFVKKVFFE